MFAYPQWNGEAKVWQISNSIIVGLATFILFLLGLGFYEVQREISSGDLITKERLLELIQQNNETRNLVIELLKVTNRMDSDLNILKHNVEEMKKRENQLDEYLKHHSHIEPSERKK